MNKENFYCKLYLNNNVKTVETYIDDENKQYVLLDDFEFLLQYASKRLEELQTKINKTIEFVESYGKSTALWQCDKDNLLKILKEVK